MVSSYTAKITFLSEGSWSYACVKILFSFTCKYTHDQLPWLHDTLPCVLICLFYDQICAKLTFPYCLLDENWSGLSFAKWTTWLKIPETLVTLWCIRSWSCPPCCFFLYFTYKSPFASKKMFVNCVNVVCKSKVVLLLKYCIYSFQYYV